MPLHAVSRLRNSGVGEWLEESGGLSLCSERVAPYRSAESSSGQSQSATRRKGRYTQQGYVGRVEAMDTSCTSDLLVKLNLQERSFIAGREPLLFHVFRLGIWMWMLSFFIFLVFFSWRCKIPHNGIILPEAQFCHLNRRPETIAPT